MNVLKEKQKFQDRLKDLSKVKKSCCHEGEGLIIPRENVSGNMMLSH